MARKTSKRAESREAASNISRPFWSGTISFGLVSVPVQLFPATRTAGVSLRMFDEDGTPIARKYECPRHEKDVDTDHLVRGFPIGDDEYVIIQDDELEAIEPRKSREIDLRAFVDGGDISPFIVQRSYFLTPTGDSNKAYRLLAAVTESSNRVGIASVVMRDREYLVAIRAQEGILCADTLRFADETRTPTDIGLPSPVSVKRTEVTRLRQLIRKNMEPRIDVRLLTDEYGEQIRRLSKQKVTKQENIVETKAADDPDEGVDSAPPDLLEVIRQSLGSVKGPAPRRRGSVRNAARDHRGSADASVSKAKLYERAKKLKIPNRSQMNKPQLVRAIDRALSKL